MGLAENFLFRKKKIQTIEEPINDSPGIQLESFRRFAPSAMSAASPTNILDFVPQNTAPPAPITPSVSPEQLQAMKLTSEMQGTGLMVPGVERQAFEEKNIPRSIRNLDKFIVENAPYLIGGSILAKSFKEAAVTGSKYLPKISSAVKKVASKYPRVANLMKLSGEAYVTGEAIGRLQGESPEEAPGGTFAGITLAHRISTMALAPFLGKSLSEIVPSTIIGSVIGTTLPADDMADKVMNVATFSLLGGAASAAMALKSFDPKQIQEIKQATKEELTLNDIPVKQAEKVADAIVEKAVEYKATGRITKGAKEELLRLRSEIESARAGKKVVAFDEEGNAIPHYRPSEFPVKGLGAKAGQLKIIDTVLEKGIETLTPVQQAKFKSLMNEVKSRRSRIAESISENRKATQTLPTGDLNLNVGDTVKVPGDKLKVIQANDEKLVLQDGKKIELDPMFDSLDVVGGMRGISRAANKAPKKIVLSGPEREALAEGQFAGKKTAKDMGETPEAILTGGLPGAGKSTALKGISAEEKAKFVEANADIIKDKAGYNKEAREFHEESSLINKMVLDKAIGQGNHVIYDSQLTNYPLAEKVIESALKRGGKAKIAFTNIDAETSAVRSKVRLLSGETDRPVDEIDAIVKGYNRALPTFIQLFKKYKNNPDVEFHLTDNNVDFVPARIIMEKTKAGVNILDQKKFDELMGIKYNKIGSKENVRYERTRKYGPADLEGARESILRRQSVLLDKKANANSARLDTANPGGRAAAPGQPQSIPSIPRVQENTPELKSPELIQSEVKPINDRFESYKNIALERGFSEVEAVKYAKEALSKENVAQSDVPIVPGQKKKQAEFGIAGGVEGFGRGKKGEQDLFSSKDVSPEVKDFLEKIESKEGEAGAISLGNLKKPDLEKLKAKIRKFGTAEEQIGEDPFWQKELFEAKRVSNIRDINALVSGKLADEKLVAMLDKIPYVDRPKAIAMTRALEKISFIKDRNRQKLLYKASAAIKGFDKDGNPIFGTKIKHTDDAGTVTESWRYTPEEAKVLWEKVSEKDRAVLKEYMAPLEEAKNLFSRELLAQEAKISEQIEGYIHKFGYEGKSLGDTVRKIFFKFRKAAPTKHRTTYVDDAGRVRELKGNLENFEKAVAKQIENVSNSKLYNEFIEKWTEMLSEPLNAKNPLKPGWVEVRGTLKTGIPSDKPTIYKKELESGEVAYGVAPAVKRQVPQEIKDLYMNVYENTNTGNILKSLGRYWKGNVLIHPGTAATNAISGGIQYATKVFDDFYKHGVLSGNFKPFINDVRATIEAFLPKNVEALKPELVGANVNISSQWGPERNIVDKFTKLGLTPFGMIETYFKRAIGLAELRTKGRRATDILHDDQLFKEVRKQTDIYGFDYSNIPAILEKFRGSAIGAWTYPFVTYGYKYGRFIERYTLGAVNQLMRGDRKEGLARLLTAGSILSMLYLYDKKQDEKVGEYVEEMNQPGELDKTGRFKVAESDGKESYLRGIKYPWLNFYQLLKSGAKMLGGEAETASETAKGILGEFVSEGPGLKLFLSEMGYTNKFDRYKTQGALRGEFAKTWIPLFRINEGINRLVNPEKTKEDTFQRAIERATFQKPTGEPKKDTRGKPMAYDRQSEALKLLTGVNVRTIDVAEYRKVRQKVIRTMKKRLFRRDVSDRSKERARDVLKILEAA